MVQGKGQKKLVSNCYAFIFCLGLCPAEVAKYCYLYGCSCNKPCGELALGENCIKIISQDKSNSLGMFLEIQRDNI